MSELITVKTVKKRNFTVLDLTAIIDRELTWEAKGFHTYLISRPEGWEINKSDLLERSDCGRDKLIRITQELESKGYLRVEKKRDDGGRFTNSTYTVFQTPEVNEEPTPETGNQGLETSNWEPATGNPPTNNNKSKKDTKKERGGPSSNGKIETAEDEDGFKQRKTKAEAEREKVEADPMLWNSHHFRKYLAAKYEAAYGKESFEYIHKKQGDGVIIGRIKKQFLDKFTRDFNLTNLHAKEYIEWVFGSDDGETEGKCKQIQRKGGTKVNFGFLSSDNLISEWWTDRDEGEFEATKEEIDKTTSIINSRLVNA